MRKQLKKPGRVVARNGIVPNIGGGDLGAAGAVDASVTGPSMAARGVVTPSSGVAPGVVTPGVVAPGIVTPGNIAPGLLAPGIVASGVVARSTVAPRRVAAIIAAPGDVGPGIVAPVVVAPGNTAPTLVAPGIVASGVKECSTVAPARVAVRIAAPNMAAPEMVAPSVAEHFAEVTAHNGAPNDAATRDIVALVVAVRGLIHHKLLASDVSARDTAAFKARGPAGLGYDVALHTPGARDPESATAPPATMFESDESAALRHRVFLYQE